MQNIV